MLYKRIKWPGTLHSLWINSSGWPGCPGDTEDPQWVRLRRNGSVPSAVDARCLPHLRRTGEETKQQAHCREDGSEVSGTG